MNALFPSIHQLEIVNVDPKGNVDPRGSYAHGRLQVSFSSLTSLEKITGIAIITLSLVTVMIGICSFAGANFMSFPSAQAMIGMGGGIALLTGGLMAVNHLRLLKNIEAYFGNKILQDSTWQDSTSYSSGEVVDEENFNYIRYTRSEPDETGMELKTYHVDFQAKPLSSSISSLCNAYGILPS